MMAKIKYLVFFLWGILYLGALNALFNPMPVLILFVACVIFVFLTSLLWIGFTINFLMQYWRDS